MAFRVTCRRDAPGCGQTELVTVSVLFVEDDPSIRIATAQTLRDDGYDVVEAANGAEALDRFEHRPPDCVLLDLMLPDADGFDVCRKFRTSSSVPIIILTAKSDSHDMVAGLEAGADDYVTKPFESKVLVARIRALLRRARGQGDRTDAVVLGGRVEVRAEDGTVSVEGREVHLTRTEFRLLCELTANLGKVLSREQLLDSVWDYDYFGETKLVDVHIHRLRSKVELDPARPAHIVTVRGLGYRAVP